MPSSHTDLRCGRAMRRTISDLDRTIEVMVP
jgi:hypothetical protein